VSELSDPLWGSHTLHYGLHLHPAASSSSFSIQALCFADWGADNDLLLVK